MWQLLVWALLVLPTAAGAQDAKLHKLQQDFVDTRFGLFIHFNMPTFCSHDWPDPDEPVATFAPRRLDCRQWAKAARRAGMAYGCLTTKHHSGFCIWTHRRRTTA